MLTDKVNATLGEDTKKEILAAIETINQKLPFLVSLTPDEKRSLPKMGDKTRSFVEKALEVAEQNEQLLPRYFEAADLRKDVELFSQLLPLSIALSQLSSKLSDTMTIAGSEAYVAALVVYRGLQNLPSGAGLQDELNELKKRFGRSSKKTTSDETDNPSKKS